MYYLRYEEKLSLLEENFGQHTFTKDVLTKMQDNNNQIFLINLGLATKTKH